MWDVQTTALICPHRNFQRKKLLVFAALQLGPMQCVTFWLSHNTKKVSSVSRAKLFCGKFLYCLMENNNFSAELLHCSIAYLATIFLFIFCKVRHYFIKCSGSFFFFLQEICMDSCLTQKSFKTELYSLLSLLCVCDEAQKPPAVVRRVKVSSQTKHEQVTGAVICR